MLSPVRAARHPLPWFFFSAWLLIHGFLWDERVTATTDGLLAAYFFKMGLDNWTELRERRDLARKLSEGGRLAVLPLDGMTVEQVLREQARLEFEYARRMGRGRTDDGA